MKLIPLALALVCLTTAAAYADSSADPTGGLDSAAAAASDAKGAKFDERKQDVLKRIGDHIAEMQQKQQCVEAATSGQAMKACFPNAGKGRKGGRFGGGASPDGKL